MTDNFVPFQPNVNPDGTANAAGRQGRRDPLRRDEARPGRAPARDARVPHVLALLQHAGHAVRRHAAPEVRRGHDRRRQRRRSRAGGLDRRRARRPCGAVGASTQTVTFTVTPSGTRRRQPEVQDRRASGPRAPAKGYTDQHRARRLARRGPLPALRQVGRVRPRGSEQHGARGAAHRPLAPPSQTIAVGETFTLPVKVHNWSDEPSERHGQPDAADRRHRRRDLEAVRDHRGGRRRRRSTSASRTRSRTRRCRRRSRATRPASSRTHVNVRITTSYTGGGTGSRTCRWRSCPRRRSRRGAAPTLDGVEGAGRVRRRVARHRQEVGAGRRRRRDCVPLGVDCGSAGAPTARTPRSPARGDDLYFFIRVRTTSRATRSRRRSASRHWLADSVEILIDPRGRASDNAMDTANTFKLGRLPVHQRPDQLATATASTARAGRVTPTTTRASRPGRSRPRSRAARTPRACRCARPRRGSGTNDTGTSHAYAGGGYNLEVKIPMALLPAAVDPGPDGPEHHALRQRRQHGRHGLDGAAAHRHEHAPGVVDVRQRAVRPVPLGPRDAARATRRRPTGRRRRPRRSWRSRSTARTRRRRSRSRPATACRSPAVTRRRRRAG